MTNEEAANYLGQQLLMTGIRNDRKAEALRLAVAALRREGELLAACITTWQKLLCEHGYSVTRVNFAELEKAIAKARAEPKGGEG